MIKMENVSFRYENSERGVDHINLSINAGECVVFIGESGCGKTTVTRLINGLAPDYYSGVKSGKIYVKNKDISEMPLYEIGKIVGSIFQDPGSQFFSSELAGEVAFACENYGFSKEEILHRTDDAIGKMRLEYLRNTPLDVFSGGEKQRTAIASVYALHPSVLVFDEPTANLDLGGIRDLHQALLELKSDGYTLIIAEHRLDWLCDIADRYVYMADGQIRKEYTSVEFCAMRDEEKAELGLRRTTTSDVRVLPDPDRKLPVAVKASGISCRKEQKQIWDNLHVFFNKGCITALTGHNGIGKTTLALAISGFLRVQQGFLYIGEKKCTRSERTKRIYYCSNDMGTQLFTGNVSEELLLNTQHNAEKTEEIREILKRLGLYDYKDAHPQSLSGGQKQRLAVACALISEKDILILDEPTSGLDGKNMLLIAEELKRAVKKGKTILVITHDEELIAVCCDYRLNL